MNSANTQELIYGRNPVLEVLRAGRRTLGSLLIQAGLEPHPGLDEIREHAERLHLPVEMLNRQELDRQARNHQGVLLQAESYPYVDLVDIMELAQDRSEPPMLLILDQLQDPQNFGTLIRTAEAVGVHGVLLPARQSVGVTPAVVSASSGASEHLLISRVNLAQAMRALKQQDVWMVGLELGDDALPVDEADLSGPIGLVVGSEGGGLRPLVRSTCDFMVYIRMRGRIESLNASVAGSIVLYRIWEQRRYVR